MKNLQSQGGILLCISAIETLNYKNYGDAGDRVASASDSGWLCLLRQIERFDTIRLTVPVAALLPFPPFVPFGSLHPPGEVREGNMLITYSNSSHTQGLILSVAGRRMRVALKGHEDPVEFTLNNDSWLAEDGQTVTFEFPLGLLESQEVLTAIQEVTVENLTAPRSCSAGGECVLRRWAVDSTRAS